MSVEGTDKDSVFGQLNAIKNAGELLGVNVEGKVSLPMGNRRLSVVEISIHAQKPRELLAVLSAALALTNKPD